MACLDPHSYYDDAQPRTARWHIALAADFGRKVLEGSITLFLAQPGTGPMDLDTRGLEIRGARTEDGQIIPFVLHPEEPILGSRLSLDLPPGTEAVTISYATSPEA